MERPPWPFQFQQCVSSDVLMRLAELILDLFVGNTVFGDVELPLRGTFYIMIGFPSGSVSSIMEPRVARFVRVHVGEDLEEQEMIREIAQQISGQLFLIIDNPTGDDFDDHRDQDDGGSSDGQED